jgi:transposase
MSPGLKLALGPILTQIAEMTLKIKQYDREIQRMTQTEYAETQPMMTIHGVGYITALTFVLTLGDKARFGRNRDVGCYLEYDQNAASRANAIRSSASPRLATLIFEVC